MATRRKKEEPITVTNVGVNINGAYIEVQNVSAAKAGPTLKAILRVMRQLRKEFPELEPVYPTVGGYTPVDYESDFYDPEERKKTGFRLN